MDSGFPAPSGARAGGSLVHAFPAARVIESCDIFFLSSSYLPYVWSGWCEVWLVLLTVPAGMYKEGIAQKER